MDACDELKMLIYAQCVARGYGGQSYIAGKLGMTRSNLNKFLRDSGRRFHATTLNAAAFMLESKAESHENIPVIQEVKINPYMIELRNIEGEIVPTWRPL